MSGRPTGLGQTVLEGIVSVTTDGAILFQPLDGSEFWIPRKVCIGGENLEEADEDVTVADWWLRQEGRL